MSPSAPPVTDDRQLQRLAVEPPEPLFPSLRHAEAMAPLVVVLAFLPTLYAVAYRTLTEAGARQGLVALQCLAAENLDEFIDPAMSAVPTPLAFQPLLMSWLTALALRLFGVGQAAGHVSSAYLCTAGLILAAYILGRRLGGDRLGLFSALLLAFNPHVLRLAQEPIPQSAAALFAVLAMAGTVAHWQKSS
ncbi:MAG TPA: glycosyltransferase family 39 protein, partial [Planctomycetaceae bacterium]|nr:glycosyltransferase family 39 protein [Planctomycetaceae bacterium]